MKKTILTRMSGFIAAGISLLACPADAATNNTFTPTTNLWMLTASTNGWAVDRFAPHTFGLATVSGRLALQIGIDPAEGLANRPPSYQSAFYNTQGFQKAPDLSTNGNWVVRASLYVPPDLTNSPSAPFRSDLWARTSVNNDEGTANYFIVGLFVGDTNNRANPAPSTFTVTWEVWDGANGVWAYLPLSVMGGWNQIEIMKNGGLIEYYVNGSLVYTDTNNVASPDLIKELSTVFIEAYNFGAAGYSASWSGDMIIDRSAPDSVDIVDVGGRRALQFTVDPSSFQGPGSFYNTKGFQIPANVGTNNHWAAYGSIYIPTNVANGSMAPYRSDLWARTSSTSTEDNADYFIVGLFVGDTNNRANPNPSTVTVTWETWDDTIGWVYVSAPVTPGWHDVRISYDNGAVYYYVDKQLVYAQTSMANPAYANYLSTVFIQTYNFGGPAYSSIWSGVGDTDASVPFLPATLKIVTVTLVAQPGFEYELHSSTNIPNAEVWTPIASAFNVNGTLQYRLSASDLLKETQFFRSALKP